MSAIFDLQQTTVQYKLRTMKATMEAGTREHELESATHTPSRDEQNRAMYLLTTHGQHQPAQVTAWT